MLVFRFEIQNTFREYGSKRFNIFNIFMVIILDSLDPKILIRGKKSNLLLEKKCVPSRGQSS